MKCYTIDFGGGDIKIEAELVKDAMNKFRKWLYNAPGDIRLPGYNCIGEEEIEL